MPSWRAHPLVAVQGPFLTLPNVLSLARVPLAAGAIACLATGQRLAAQLLMVAAFATDALDGAVARATQTTSEWGRLLDPMADKLVFAVVGLSLAVLGLVPWWLVGVIVGRDLLIIIGGLLHLRGGRVPRPLVAGKVSTVLLALYLGKQAFWPAPAVFGGLDVLGWIAVSVLGGSTVAYVLHDREHRPRPRIGDRPTTDPATAQELPLSRADASGMVDGMDSAGLINAVAARAGTDPAISRRLVAATLGTLHSHVGVPMPMLVALLPENAQTEVGSEASFEDLTAWVARTFEVTEGVAIEWVDAALTEVSAALPGEVRGRLRAAVPTAYADRLVDPQPHTRPAPPSAPPRAGTLASGEPGARNSLASGSPQRSHAMSIAESDDPHGGETLASADPRDDES